MKNQVSNYHSVCEDRITLHKLYSGSVALFRGVEPDKESVRARLAKIEAQQKEVLHALRYMSKDVGDGEARGFLHPIAEGYRDCSSFSKQVQHLGADKGNAQEVWANPINEQYRAIFDTIRYV